MRGESMKGKSKKSTYSTTFGVDPMFSAATYSFRFCSGKLAERMSVEMSCGECVRANSSASCSVLNTLYGRFALGVLHGRNTLYLYSGRFAFLYFLTVSAVFTESPLDFDSEKLLQNCYTKKRVSCETRFKFISCC